MDLFAPETAHPDWPINAGLMADLASLVRKYQRHLIANPDPADPWWFLVDPDAP